MDLFTEKEWRELEYEALCDQMARHMLTASNDIQEKLQQDYNEISMAYNHIIAHQESCLLSDEWEDMDGDITFGNHDSFSSQDYLHLWDEHEMLYDLNAFESSMHTHAYLAHAPQGTTTCDTVLNVTTWGPNYSTGETIYGKVYIPKHLAHNIKQRFDQNPPLCKIAYNGSEDSREAANIRMPWKLTHIL